MKGALIVLVMVLATGCSDDGPTSPFPYTATQATSPVDVVHLLNSALETRNVLQYDSLLTRDYTFVFNPEDAADDTLGIPPSWGYSDEMQAMRDLFRSDDVEEIKAQWELNPMEESEVPGADGMIVIFNIFIEVTTRLPSGEPLFLQAMGTSRLHLKQQPWTDPNGENVWQMVQWDDLTLRPSPNLAATRTTTWGQIKAGFR